MTDKKLQQKMMDEWQEARRGFHYPQLPAPQLVDDIPNGYIDMESLETRVSEPFIKGFREHGIDESTALNEVLTHELAHFMRYPGSALNVLRLQKAMMSVVDGEKAGNLRRSFAEVQVNNFMLNERKHPATASMRKAYGLEGSDPMTRIEYGLYQAISGQDFGVELTPEEHAIVERLKEIDYADKDIEMFNARRFAEVLKDYQPPQQQQGKQGNQRGDGQGQGKNHPGSGMEIFSDNQIREGLRQFAKECSDPGEFEKVAQQVLSDIEKKDGNEEGDQRRSTGLHPGIDKGITELARNFYTALAENYAIPIRKRPLHKNGSLYPHSHTEFSVSDPITEIDPFSSPGIMPGVTKKWVRKEGEVTSDFEGIPDSIILKDNSPSMFMRAGGNPVSPNARVYHDIVGATAIANAYIKNGARVAVYSFGSNDRFMNFSRNREQVHENLRRFSTDGGTTFTPRFLEGLLNDSPGQYDITVVSDMAISNLDSFVQTMLAIPQTHRIHLLYTNPTTMEYVASLTEHFGKVDNVAILPLIGEANIKQITMGELKKSVH